MSLVIRDLIKSFNQPGGGSLTVLDIEKFDVGTDGQSEQVCLIGESGGGKTTLLHLIAGLLVPDSGSIQVAGVELTSLSEQGRDRVRAASVGYVFQTFNLLPAFTAIENVRLGMTFGNGRHDAARAGHLLDRVGLADRANYKPSQLSVGQQQRVAIARSLAGKPKLLLADEPTANVDHNSAQTVLDLIRTSCSEEQISLLMVTHSMEVASTFDRVEKLDEINRAYSKSCLNPNNFKESCSQSFMSLLQIAWRNFCHRSLSSILTTLSLALGVGLVVAVLAAYGIITEAFSRNAQAGFNLVVGPGKGSPLQLTLNSVYYLSQPIENIRYSKFMEFYTQEQRAEMLRKYGGDPALAQRDGEYAAYIGEGGFAIPLALGDYFGEFRVVGTTPDFFEKLRLGEALDEKFSFSSGRALTEHSDEYGYFEAVMGSRVAAEMNIKVGDQFNPSHGNPDGTGHGQGFTVVGVLDPTGTPNDRAAFVNLEGFYLLDKHSLPLSDDEIVQPPTETYEDAAGFKPLTIPQREVTSILIRNAIPFHAAGMYDTIKENDVEIQAAAPVGEIAKLMNAIVGPLLTALLVITLMTCVVVAIGVLVAIYNSMNDRKRDIAVMRALGARRETVTTIILFESLLIAVIGGALGWIIAHGAIWACSGQIEAHTGVSVHLFSTSTYEWMVLPLVLALALLAGLLPALAAYRTDVGSNLAA